MSTVSVAPHPHTSAARWYESAVVRLTSLAALLTAGATYEAHRLVALGNNDIWWHVRSGLWMLQHHAVPRTGLFSQAANLSWVDASWGFDLASGAAVRALGLAGLPMLLMLVQVAVATALFALAWEASRRFWPAVILAGVAQYSIAPLQPRPGLCSMVLLSAELALLLRARRTRGARELYWLPAIFLLWANVDRQVLYGLAMLGLFCVAICVEHYGWKGEPAVHPAKLGVIAVASFAATFWNPYGWRLHALMWNSAINTASDRYFRELHAMRFRQPQDYALMLLAMTAFFALGRRRSRDLFLILLLLVSAAISFRLVRDNWLVVVVSVGIIGDGLYDKSSEAAWRFRTRVGAAVATAALCVAVILAAAVRLPAAGQLETEAGKKFPLRAADYIRQNGFGQPLFNAYDWGGFLTWYLPEYPVSIDGRADLYGEALNTAYFRLIQAEVPLESDTSFERGRTFLLQANTPMAQALGTMAGFHAVYGDNQAVVFVRE